MPRRDYNYTVKYLTIDGKKVTLTRRVLVRALASWLMALHPDFANHTQRQREEIAVGLLNSRFGIGCW